MDTTTSKQSLLKRWIISCASGEVIGISSAAALAIGFNYLIGEPQSIWLKMLNILVMLLAGAIEGAALGWFQWKVLKDRFVKLTLNDWMGYTIAVAVLGWALGMIPTMFFAQAAENQTAKVAAVEPALWLVLPGAAAMGLLLGAFFGLFQWFALRKHSKSAARWIFANALGWMFGMVWIFIGATLPDETTPIPLIVGMGAAGGIMAGISVGLVTGLFLLTIHPNLSSEVK